MQGFEEHIQELRKRLKLVTVFLFASTVLSFYFSSDILIWLQADLGFSLHALTAYEVFYTEILISLIVGFFISLPFILYEAIAFMRPGLKDKEYRALRNYLPFSVLLFVGGAAFAYNVIVKISLSFLQGTAEAADVAALWGLQNTIGFALKLSALTGVIFQLPIVSVVLARTGLIDSEMMVNYRAYFIVFTLLISAVATPPDVVSQLLVTGPVLILYQLSIFLVGHVEA